MSKVFSFTCSKCRNLHTGSPSVGFDRPQYWNERLNSDPASSLSDDLCVVEARDYFIRCVLEMPIHGAVEPFLWGLWVSQSEKNFKDYAEAFPEVPERTTFGYLANWPQGYPDTLGLHMSVHWRVGNDRPWLQIEPSDHPLYQDVAQGISWERAIELFMPALHRPGGH